MKENSRDVSKPELKEEVANSKDTSGKKEIGKENSGLDLTSLHTHPTSTPSFKGLC